MRKSTLTKLALMFLLVISVSGIGATGSQAASTHARVNLALNDGIRPVVGLPVSVLQNNRYLAQPVTDRFGKISVTLKRGVTYRFLAYRYFSCGYHYFSVNFTVPVSNVAIYDLRGQMYRQLYPGCRSI